ncbi:MAG: family 78 glycoside hydrolase catalytic domain, partial [Clostridia bacterium]|nr:family 78 glycoside hydrolase catalytic domain [Clostridia bacterium]
ETAIIDLGQNMVGWPLISVSGRGGTQIIMRFGEMLNDSGSTSRGNDGPEGSVYTSNYRSAASTNRYIMSGDGVENYHTEYSFYGFRYVSITVSDTVTFHSVRGQVVGSVNPESGRLTTSDASVNQLISNIIWSMRGNYLSVPTDCPQRDERLGWTGDTQVFAGTGSYNANVAPFFRKWLTDCIDSQMNDGSYPDVIPRSNATGSGAAAWGDAGIIVPYTMYKKYGDIYVIRRNYESMEKYMDFLIKNGGPLERYGDWLAYQETEQKLICKAYYAYDALLMAEMSEALGYSQRKDFYRGIYENVKREYIGSYFDEMGLIPGSQTSAILTLLADLVPNEDMRYSVLTMLRNNIKKNGWKLQTGFVGTANIVNVLSLMGDDETAYTLLLQRDNPSWLYSVDQGATTTWERWDSYTLARGFGDVGMNSFNHYAYGCVGEWMYTYMAGINGSGTAGFKEFELSPRIDPKLRITSCDAEYDCVYGTIRSSWIVDESGALYYDFSVPANTSCKVVLPLKIGEKEVASISNGNISVNISDLSGGDIIAEGLSFTEIQNGCIILKAVSGNFSIRLS